MTGWTIRPVVIRTLALLTAVGVAAALIGGFVLPSFGDSGDDDTAARNQVVSRANDFAVAMNTFDYADLEGYQSRIRSLLTAEYYQDFEKNTKATAAVLEKSKVTLQSGEAKVVSVGIKSIDDDSGEVLVAVNASIMSDKATASVPRKFRWTVSFVKIKEEWLVSRFESLAPVEAAASPAPSAPVPTEGGKR